MLSEDTMAIPVEIALRLLMLARLPRQGIRPPLAPMQMMQGEPMKTLTLPARAPRQGVGHGRRAHLPRVGPAKARIYGSAMCAERNGPRQIASCRRVAAALSVPHVLLKSCVSSLKGLRRKSVPLG